jgi:hypothetical protein
MIPLLIPAIPLHKSLPKFMNTSTHTAHIKPRVLTASEVQQYVGGRENFRRLTHAGWLAPIKGKSKGMDYCVRDVDAAVDRACLNGWPPPAP